jgi:hypothetical protein
MSRQPKILKYSTVIVSLVTVSACAQVPSPATEWLTGSLQYTGVELYANVVNAGSALGYTVFERRSITVTVRPDSSAQVIVTHASPEGFENASERMRWLTAGKPQFPSAMRAGTRLTIRPGSFSFLPFPPRLSFRQALALSPSPGRISDIILGGQQMPAGSDRSFYLAMQLATLLAIAPVRGAVRHAAWKALLSLAGMHGCTGGHDGVGRGGHWMCLRTPAHELKILSSARKQVVLCVENLLTAPSLLYPGVPAGSLIGSNTYVTHAAR